MSSGHQLQTKNHDLNSTANPKSRFEFAPGDTEEEFAPGDTEEFKFNQNLNLNLYREIQRNLSFSISTS